MRKAIILLGVLGLITISNAENVIATGTLSIEDMKKAILKLKQENDMQSARIDFLENKVSDLEKLKSELEKAIAEANKPLKEEKEEKEKVKPAITKAKTYCAIANLNVRKGPSKDEPVIARLKEGTVVSGTEKKRSWLKILKPSGWVSSLYLRECDGRKEK